MESTDLTVPTHLQDLFDKSVAQGDLAPMHQCNLAALLRRHSDALATGPMELEYCSVLEHDIDTGDAEPIRQPPRRPPLSARQAEEDILNEMLQTSVIEPSNSPWSSPVCMVRKKDGSYRYCVDYRRMNSVTIKDAFPVPDVKDALDSLRGAKYFATIDLSSGYRQLGMTKRAKERSAFCTKRGLYQFTRMPCGLSNAPASFSYFFRVLNGTQRNYCHTRRELLAVITSLQHFRHYLLGNKVILRTDHHSLKWLRTFKRPEGISARWIETLAEFDFEIEHRAGRLHFNADAISRQNCKQCRGKVASDNWIDECERADQLVEPLSLHTIQLRSEFSDDAIAELQAEDSEIGKAYKVMSENLDPSTDEFRALPLESRRLLSMQPEVRLQDNLMVKERDGRVQVVVPVVLRKRLFEITHNAAHLGSRRTYQQLNTSYYWYGCARTSSVGITNVSIVPKAKDHHFVHMVNYRRYRLVLQWIWSQWIFSQAYQQLMMDQNIFSWFWTLSQSGWKPIHFRTKRPRRASQLCTMACSPDSDYLVNYIQTKVEILRVN